MVGFISTMRQADDEQEIAEKQEKNSLLRLLAPVQFLVS
jgi:hypothetical protein